MASVIPKSWAPGQWVLGTVFPNVTGLSLTLSHLASYTTLRGYAVYGPGAI